MSTETSPPLTLIITTSPTPSAPSTNLLCSVLRSFRQHCPALLDCPVVVVFDTFDRIGPRDRLKRGQVTAERARDYELYKENVKTLFLDEYSRRGEPSLLAATLQAEAEFGFNNSLADSVSYTAIQTGDKRVSFIEPSARLGFGLAVRSALRLAETPYVWVHQHDWSLVADIPLSPLVRVMQSTSAASAASADDVPVRYICLPSVRLLQYALSDHVTHYPALRQLTATLRRTFVPDPQSGTAIELTPMFFWHDKPHLASRQHYLDRVFPTRLAIARGAFIEDVIGQRARGQMKEGRWARWACWLYYPQDGRLLCLRHLDGRKDREQGRRLQLARLAKDNTSCTESDIVAPD